jgi:hypothetical protein
MLMSISTALQRVLGAYNGRLAIAVIQTVSTAVSNGVKAIMAFSQGQIGIVRL